jgi:hypothetical protein
MRLMNFQAAESGDDWARVANSWPRRWLERNCCDRAGAEAVGSSTTGQLHRTGLLSVVTGRMGDMTASPNDSSSAAPLVPPHRGKSKAPNFELAKAARVGLASQQEERAQLTGTSRQRNHCAGSVRVGGHDVVASAEQRIHHSTYPRTDQPHRRTSRDQSNPSHPNGPAEA